MPEVSFSVSECIYGWTAAFLRSGNSITLRIKLDPQYPISTTALDALKVTWRDGIIAKWSNKFACPPSAHNLTFDVLWVTTGQHHTVAVHRGPYSTDMLNWGDDESGDVAAHEAGHMFGNPDEYADTTNCPNRNPVNTGNIMDVVAGATVQRLYDAICAQPQAPPRPTVNICEFNSDSLIMNPNKVTLSISGGVPSRRLSILVSVDQLEGVNFTLSDKRNDVEATAAGVASPGFFESIDEFASEKSLVEEISMDSRFVPDSLVAKIEIENGPNKMVFRYPVKRISPPDEFGATNPLLTLHPETESRLLHFLHSSVCLEAAKTTLRDDKRLK